MKTTMNISVDSSLKKAFKDVATAMWTNPSNLMQMLMTNAVNTGKVSIDVFDCIHTEEDEAAYQEAMKDLENGDVMTQSEAIQLVEKKLNRKISLD